MFTIRAVYTMSNIYIQVYKYIIYIRRFETSCKSCARASGFFKRNAENYRESRKTSTKSILTENVFPAVFLAKNYYPRRAGDLHGVFILVLCCTVKRKVSAKKIPNVVCLVIMYKVTKFIFRIVGEKCIVEGPLCLSIVTIIQRPSDIFNTLVAFQRYALLND